MDSVFPAGACPLLCSAPDGAGPLPGTLCGDWRFQAGPRSLPPLTHFQRCCTTSMTFTALQGRVVHLQEKTNKYGGCRSASVQTLLLWTSVSILAPQHLWHLLACVTAWLWMLKWCDCKTLQVADEGQCVQGCEGKFLLSELQDWFSPHVFVLSNFVFNWLMIKTTVCHISTRWLNVIND